MIKIICDQSTPTEEGLYLFVGRYTKHPELLNVVQYPAVVKYGINWPSYLGVSSSGGRDVSQFHGQFSKKLEII